MDDWLHQFKSGTFALPERFRDLANGAYVKHILAPVRSRNWASSWSNDRVSSHRPSCSSDLLGVEFGQCEFGDRASNQVAG